MKVTVIGDADRISAVAEAVEQCNAQVRQAIEKVKALDTGGSYKAAYIRSTVEDILRELAA